MSNVERLPGAVGPASSRSVATSKPNGTGMGSSRVRSNTETPPSGASTRDVPATWRTRWPASVRTPLAGRAVVLATARPPTARIRPRHDDVGLASRFRRSGWTKTAEPSSAYSKRSTSLTGMVDVATLPQSLVSKHVSNVPAIRRNARSPMGIKAKSPRPSSKGGAAKPPSTRSSGDPRCGKKRPSTKAPPTKMLRWPLTIMGSTVTLSLRPTRMPSATRSPFPAKENVRAELGGLNGGRDVCVSVWGSIHTSDVAWLSGPNSSHCKTTASEADGSAISPRARNVVDATRSTQPIPRGVQVPSSPRLKT